MYSKQFLYKDYCQTAYTRVTKGISCKRARMTSLLVDPYRKSWSICKAIIRYLRWTKFSRSSTKTQASDSDTKSTAELFWMEGLVLEELRILSTTTYTRPNRKIIHSSGTSKMVASLLCQAKPIQINQYLQESLCLGTVLDSSKLVGKVRELPTALMVSSSAWWAAPTSLGRVSMGCEEGNLIYYRIQTSKAVAITHHQVSPRPQYQKLPTSSSVWTAFSKIKMMPPLSTKLKLHLILTNSKTIIMLTSISLRRSSRQNYSIQVNRLKSIYRHLLPWITVKVQVWGLRERVRVQILRCSTASTKF